MVNSYVVCLTLATVLVVGCNAKIEFRSNQDAAKLSNKPAIQVTDRIPVVASPGATVALIGSNFRPEMKLALADGLTIAAVVESDTKASFQVPAGTPFGGAELTVTQDGVTQKITLIFTAGQTDHPIVTADPATQCAGIKYYDATGTLREGSKDCTAPGNCNADGQVGCVAVAGYPAARVNASNLDAGNVKRGVTIGGVTGAFPSAANPVPRYSDTGATMNTQASGGITTGFTNFITDLTRAGSFEFWDSTGVRRTGSGDADIVNANVISGVAFENLGINGGSVVPTAWDVRAGSFVGLSTGKLKANCRNGGRTGTFDITMPQSASVDSETEQLTVTAHGFLSNQTVRISYLFSLVPTGLDNTTTYYVIYDDLNTIRLSASTGPGGPGAAVEITEVGADVTVFRWNDGTLNTSDTIDDFNHTNAGGVLISADQPWGSTNNWCGGLEAVANDTNVWKDTTTGTCASFPANCRYQDKISGLTWSKTQNAGTAMAWGKAMDLCNTLTHDGLAGWRLPTQKELMDAYSHGIWTVVNDNWITSAQMIANNFWSSSTLSHSTSFVWTGDLKVGNMIPKNKTYPSHVACVR